MKTHRLVIALSLTLVTACSQAAGSDPTPEHRDVHAEAVKPRTGTVADKPAAKTAVQLAGRAAPPVAKAAGEAAVGHEGCDCDKGKCAGQDEDDGRVEEIPAGASPSRGPSAAPVTVVVFSDFQCPFCRKSEATVRELEAAYPGKIRYVWKNHPLPFHDHAHLAAKAALAAGEQGKFWEYHDALFAHQDALDRASLERYAEDLGLDGRRFHAALEDTRLDAAVDADEAEADRLAIKGTPTFFVNGRRVIGAQPLSAFKERVDQVLSAR
ncbi:MAG: thioredoxin domain-containing protein [Byssovorax sp.]